MPTVFKDGIVSKNGVNQGKQVSNNTVKENPDAVKPGNSTYMGLEDEYDVGLDYDTQSTIGGILDGFREEDFYNGKNGNVLHKYNSYNYVFTLSSLSADQMKEPKFYFNLSGENFTNYLVLRSGGYKRSDVAGAREEAFANETNYEYMGPTGYYKAEMSGGNNIKTDSKQKNKDLFIDNIQMNTTMDLGENGSSNLTTGSFEVTEPYSVGGFYEELYNAAIFAGHDHYLSAPFLLSLQFVGHRFENGELVTETVPRATRYFPIVIQSSNMNVTEAGSKYMVEFYGVNAQANRAVVNSLPANLGGPRQQKPTVASVLYHLFNELNVEMKKQEKEEEGEEVEKKIAENTANVSQQTANAVKNAGGKVKPFQRDRYMIWFPKKYGTVAKEDVTMLNTGNTMMSKKSSDGADILMYQGIGAIDPYGLWESEASTFLSSDGAKPFNAKDYASLNSSLSINNHIGASKMQSSEMETYTGFYQVENYDTALEKSNEVLKTATENARTKRTEFLDAKAKADNLRADFEALAKKYYKLSSKDLEKFDVRQTITFQNFNEIDPDDADKSGNKKVVNNPVNQSKLKKLEDIRLDLMKAINEMEAAERSVKAAELHISVLGASRDTITDKKYIRYGKGAENWNFKKGTRIDDNIHKVIFDSMYAKELDGDKLAAEYEATGYVPWYRIEKIAHLRGFDTYRNQEVWDYHYVIQPFKIHYSSMPLPQDVYIYDELKKLAVREYNYIYTGKNLDVLEFDLEFNNLFASVISYQKQQTAEGSQGTASQETVAVKPPPFSQVIQKSAENMVGAKKSTKVAKTTSTTQNSPKANNASDTAQFLHDMMYGRSYEKSLLNAEITLVGDPVYLLSSGITNRALLEADEVETDIGEINCFSREGDIIFRFGTAEDYPTWNEIQGGNATMQLDESVYSGAYKVTTVESSFSGGAFTQKLSAYRRPNQPNDYREKRDPVPLRNEPAPDSKHGPASAENIEKMKKAPVKKLSKEDLENLRYHGPGALGGIQSQAVVEIPSASLGLQPTALGGSIFASISEATQISQQLNAGTFNPANFVPESVSKAVEGVGSNVSIKNVGGESIVSSRSNIINSSTYDAEFARSVSQRNIG